ncbi:class I SAM-dependent methyltransferase [Postechiella marina]|uniref:Class I SAM-dependent methyltransferase n=1 Tax=Postechiella marina TaxID=943941 RepID=A0ABP8C7B9_9FLAO
MNKKIKKPWPTKAAMAQIYQQHLWGGNTHDFYSGSGSHNPEIVESYLKVVIQFLKTQKPPLVVCDLGCGDFNIGKQLVPFSQKYIGIDIVDNLIDRNNKLFKADNLEFHCLDIAKDLLPKADCVILRQVLQHISNAEIEHIVTKLSNYKYIIITEHIPKGAFTPNKNIISGQGIRIKQNSGVNLLTAPFNLKIKEEKILDEYIVKENKGCIVTTLYQVF